MPGNPTRDFALVASGSIGKRSKQSYKTLVALGKNYGPSYGRIILRSSGQENEKGCDNRRIQIWWMKREVEHFVCTAGASKTYTLER